MSFLRGASCALAAMCLLLVNTAFVVSSEDVVESGWNLAQIIEEVPFSDPFPSQVAVDGLGNAIAVWSQYDEYTESIWSNRYVVGDGWGTAELIETDHSGGAGDPRVAADGSGNAIAVWNQRIGTVLNVVSNRYVVGEGWGTAELIETSEMETVNPHMAIAPSGIAIAVWCQHDGLHYNIWSNWFVPGTGWGSPELVQTDSDWHATAPQVAVDVHGNATAVWCQFDGTRNNMWSNRYLVGTGWGTAEMIEGQDGYVLEPRLSVDGSGNAIAVWPQDDGVYESIWSNRYVVGEGWGIAEPIEVCDYSDAWTPQVAVDGLGNAIAIWIQFDSTYNVWSNRYVVGEGWGAAELAETKGLMAQYPQLAIDQTGNATVVWQDGYYLECGIWSNRYIIGTGWGEAELVEFGAGDAVSPDVASDPFGNAVAVWLQDDGDEYSIWSNRYIAPDSTPPSLSVDSPSDGFTTQTANVLVSGVTEPGVVLRVNGLSIGVESNGSFVCTVALVEGTNVISAIATDTSNNSARVSVSVTYVNPVHDLEEQLAALQVQLDDALADLTAVQAQLAAALEELDALQVQLDDATADVVDLQGQLDAAEDALATVQGLLDDALDDLAAVETQLADSLGDVDVLQAQLNSALVNLTLADDELGNALDDLTAVQDELVTTNDDLDDARSQNLLLMVVLAVAAVMAVVMAIMYFRLRGKAGDSGGGAEDD